MRTLVPANKHADDKLEEGHRLQAGLVEGFNVLSENSKTRKARYTRSVFSELGPLGEGKIVELPESVLHCGVRHSYYTLS